MMQCQKVIMSERRGGKYELSQGIEYKAFVSKVLRCMFSE